MIDQHERDRMRDAIGDILDLAPSAPEHPPQATPSHGRSNAAVPRRRLIVAVAAAAVAVAGLAGLILVAGSNSTAPASTTEPSPRPTSVSDPRPLALTDALAPSEWVIAPTLPNGTEFLYARRDDLPDQRRAIAYGEPRGNGTDEELWIWIGWEPPGSTDETVTIDGIEWSVGSSSPDWWFASRRVGDTMLSVVAEGDLDRAVLGDLAVVDESDLPFAPLGGPDDATDVARTELGGESYTYAIQQSGRRYGCNWVISDTGGFSGRCGSMVRPDAVITIDGGSTTHPAGRPATVDAVRSGSVTTDAASVEVEFADGTVVIVEPTDRSGTFDTHFWIAAATISTDSQTGTPVTDESVAEVRAFDADGNILGSATPAWLAQP